MSYYCAYCGVSDDLLATLQGTKYLESIRELYPRFNQYSLFCENCMKKIILTLKEVDSIDELTTTSINTSNEKVSTTSVPSNFSTITTTFNDIFDNVKSDTSDNNNNNSSTEVDINKTNSKSAPTFSEIPLYRKAAPKSVKEAKIKLMKQKQRLILRKELLKNNSVTSTPSETSLEAQQIHSKNYVPRNNTIASRMTPDIISNNSTNSDRQEHITRNKIPYNRDSNDNPIPPLLPIFQHRRQNGG